MAIYQNGKEVTPKLNGKNLSRVMYNGKKIYPSDKGIDPTTAPNGVYVYSNDGLLYNPDNWNTANNDSAVGVAVVTDNCKFAIGKTERSSIIVWSVALYITDVDGIITTTDSSVAQSDFAGENNTAIIRAAASGEDASNNAAHWCYAQTITVNGITKHGYLAAVGEWQAAYDNKAAVDSVLSLIGGIAMIIGYHWASTVYNAYHAWIFSWKDGYLSYTNKNTSLYRAIPIYSLD